ncbi:MAG: protein translocase subunit SecD [Candidatus Omnitrophota bacterium]|nr:protein translocase subunit SecD [Candidatus Omnitrophota bacterium]
MYRRLTPWILTILAVAGLAVWSAFPLKEKISLGLDLQGGMHLILKVDTAKLPPEARADAAERALEVIRNRIDQFGVKEPSIHQQGKDEIVVQLPGITDRERALAIVQQVAHLEFRMVSADPELLKKAIAGEMVDGYEVVRDAQGEPYLLERQVPLTGEGLANAHVDYGQFGSPEVSFALTPAGSKVFSQLTASNIGRRLAIVLDGRVKSAPVIQGQISDQGQITGRFTQQEALDLALVLRSGALPAPLVVEEERTIGPLLGNDSIRAGVKATGIGIGMVFLFMAVYYLLPGLIACTALALNLLLILGGLALFHATLTLPGIAGIVLTLGMAVDANVLIFERMREELKLGRTIRQVITNGYDRAFSAILDSNLTTVLAAFLLFQFGTGPIRGFAVTTVIGLTASMFTAVVVTRVIFEALHRAKMLPQIRMLHLIGQTKLDFLKPRKICYVISLLCVVGGLGYFSTLGSRAYGIDFSGGQIQQYHFQKPVPMDSVRSAVRDAGVQDASLQQFGQPNDVMIQTGGDTVKEVQEKLRASFPDNPPELVRVEQVGPSVGKDLSKRALQAIFWALVSISLYVGFRFRSWSFGVAGIVALLHDVLIALIALAITGRPVSLTLIAAFLTIAGYSINDTIVIYDRIRELRRTARKMPFSELINLALNQTLSRTLLTSGVTLLTVVSLFMFGGDILNDLAFALGVGFISGVYSTVYIATPLLLLWEKKR